MNATVRAGVLVAAVVWPFLLGGPGAHRIGTHAVALALAGLSLTVAFGWLRVVSLHVPAAMAVGVLAGGAAFGAGQGLPLAVLLAGLAGAVVTTAAAAPALGRMAMLVPATTLLLTVGVWGVVLPALGGSPFARPVIVGIDLGSERALYLFGVAVFAAGWYVLDNLARADLGLRLRALGASPGLLQHSGGRLTHSWLVGFAISGVLAGLSGLVLALLWQGVADASLLSPAWAVALLAIPVAGGSRTPLGAVIGTLVVVPGGRLLGLVLPAGDLVVAGTVLVVFLMLRVDGLPGLVAAWRQA